MNAIAIEGMIFFLKRLIDSRVYDKLESLVAEFFTADLPGETKRQRVLEALRKLGGVLAPAIAATASWLLNLALELAVARLKAGAQK